LQRLLATGTREVVIPYALELADRIPPVALRLRRDFTLLQTLIKAHALLHRETRERDSRGHIVATLEDYAVVRELVATLFAEAIEATVPETVRETVTAVAELLKSVAAPPTDDHNTLGAAAGVSLTKLAKRLGLDKGPTSHRLSRAITLGYLKNLEDKKGRPARIVLADPLPDEIQILPDPKVLQCCSVAEGVTQGGEATEASDEPENTAPCYTPQTTPQHCNTSPEGGNGTAPVCSQCGAAEPGPLEPEGEVWLHPECRGFWFAEHPEAAEAPPPTTASLSA
jgi:hypothetical protein